VRGLDKEYHTTMNFLSFLRGGCWLADMDDNLTFNKEVENSGGKLYTCSIDQAHGSVLCCTGLDW